MDSVCIDVNPFKNAPTLEFGTKLLVKNKAKKKVKVLIILKCVDDMYI